MICPAGFSPLQIWNLNVEGTRRTWPGPTRYEVALVTAKVTDAPEVGFKDPLPGVTTSSPSSFSC